MQRVAVGEEVREAPAPVEKKIVDLRALVRSRFQL
jgi:hypothetical protein